MKKTGFLALAVQLGYRPKETRVAEGASVKAKKRGTPGTFQLRDAKSQLT